MSHMNYNRVRARRFTSNCRGFRLNIRRFSVHRLRAKFYCLFNILRRRWRSLYKHARNICRNKNKDTRDQYVVPNTVFQNRLRSFGRSNSFYSEAIADCLEFIKRSSVSVDDDISEEQEYAFVQQKFCVN